MTSQYCFLAAEGLIFLKRGYLPFCSPAQLEDPWLQVNSQYQQQNTPRLGAEDFRQHLQQQYQKLPENLKAMVSFDYFAQQSQGKREQIEKSLVTKQLKKTPLFNSADVQNWRVLELFTDWQDASLWQQFSASGQGLVLEFDVKTAFFKSDSYNEQAQHFSSVEQVDSWLPEDDVYYFFHQPKIKGAKRQLAWRLIRQLDAADRQIEVQGAIRAMYRLPYKAVKRVILGYRCSPDYCQQVKRYLSQDIHYRHVECVQAQLNPGTMRLEQAPI